MVGTSTDPIQVHKLCINYTPNKHQLYTNYTPIIHQLYTNYTSIRHKLYIIYISIMHQLYIIYISIILQLYINYTSIIPYIICCTQGKYTVHNTTHYVLHFREPGFPKIWSKVIFFEDQSLKKKNSNFLLICKKINKKIAVDFCNICHSLYPKFY